MISFERLSRVISLSLHGSYLGKRLCSTLLVAQFVMALSSAHLLLPIGAAMADMQTIRTEENGVVHHRLESCDYERGIAIAHYTHRHDEPQYQFELTDMCFQRETGRLWASEPAENFTLVQQDPSISWYEDLASEIGRSGSKGKFSAGGYAPISGKPDIRTSYVDLFFDPTQPDVTRPTEFHQHTADDVGLMGYLFEKQALPEEAAGKTYRIALTGFDWGLSDPASRNARYDRNKSDLVLNSDSLVFEQDGTVMDAGELLDPDGGNVNGKVTSGQLRLALHPDGTISGEGQFEIENPRLAGFEPGEWVSASWKIDKLVGHLAGEGATGFRLKGFASGETRYHDGYVGKIIGTLNVRGTDLAFEEEFLVGGQ
ncbi:hypothetical protein [Stappia sp. MMSF_3263]|nr:hypothetical protein [Stappia sp. MMSF_3263]